MLAFQNTNGLLYLFSPDIAWEIICDVATEVNKVLINNNIITKLHCTLTPSRISEAPAKLIIKDPN